MNWNQNITHCKYIHLFCPSPNSLVSSTHDFWIEECVECPDLCIAFLFSSFHEHVHVKIDDLRKKNEVIIIIVNYNRCYVYILSIDNYNLDIYIYVGILLAEFSKCIILPFSTFHFRYNIHNLYLPLNVCFNFPYSI